jgi:hypothetical protein
MVPTERNAGRRGEFPARPSAAKRPDVEPGEILPYHRGVKYRFERAKADMESLISNLLAHFEQGSLSRRDLVQSLAMPAGSAAAAAQEDLDFGSANIDHISIQVADQQRSVDFYQKMFGFSVISQDQRLGIIRLGTTRTLISPNHQSPAARVDHFAIGVARFSKESAVRYLKQRKWGVRKMTPMPACTSRTPTGSTCRSFLRDDERECSENRDNSCKEGSHDTKGSDVCDFRVFDGDQRGIRSGSRAAGQEARGRGLCPHRERL